MNVLITGSSGLIGTALIDELTSKGHTVHRMVRNQSTDVPFSWNPVEGKINFDESTKIDAVVHLAGANIGDGRWNEARKKAILESRELGTHVLSSTLAKLNKKPKVFISGSAVGFYGNSGDEIVDESSKAGSDFLAQVCQKWEKATKPASDAGIRTVNIRTGIVLSSRGGALKRMLLPFKMGLGGIIGNGKQYMSWVSINDVSNMIQFIIETESISGPVNLVSNKPVTNYEFTRSLGKVLRRPTFFRIPAFLMKMIFGEMGDAVLLSSTRTVPKKLNEAGYIFVHEHLEKALNDILKKS